MQKKTAILLINLGTPDSPSVKDVRKYLFQFLNDPRVIDLPWLLRKFLVNMIIVPFRAPKSAKIYQELWTENGSPLLYYGNTVKDKIQEKYPDKEHNEVFLAMRYGNPSIDSVLKTIKKKGFHKIIVFPLFPQYASSSTGSALEKVMENIRKWWVIPELKIISQYYDHPAFIDAWEDRGRNYKHEDYDHVLFSFHGVPIRHLDKNYEDGKPCDDHNCDKELTEDNYLCYKAACYSTARSIAERLDIPLTKYTVAFQSRLGRDPWVQPFSDHVIKDMAKKGAKKLLVFSPAFTADCLETSVEIGIEYKQLFLENGGEELQLVDSLNDNPAWIEAIYDIIN